MSHHYMHPIRVKPAPNGLPVRFSWHRCWYPISEVFSTWHLKGRWWEQPSNAAIASTATIALNCGATDRTCCRVLYSGAAGEQAPGIYLLTSIGKAPAGARTTARWRSGVPTILNA
jgi:hypothetical protein